MIYGKDLISLSWSDYELLDSGDNTKLERFGEVIVTRPETQALWKKQRPELWENAHAEFSSTKSGTQKGKWSIKKPVPESWQMSWNGARFLAMLTGFKHLGVFPEQAPNWKWIDEHVKGFRNPSSDEGFRKPNVLNLFGYTGIASIVATQAAKTAEGDSPDTTTSSGAFITHVDASKQSLDWAHKNAILSGIREDRIRWIPDDALKFVKREARRGIVYDGIILDPPAFGRGTKGEVWKIEENFLQLLELLKKIFSDKRGSFFLVNSYAAGYANRSFSQAIESVFGDVNGESGELQIKESSSERVIPAGIYVRFIR